MGRLSQANGIAPLYGSGFTTSSQPYLLMPFYQHGSLQDRIEGQGAMPAEQVRRVGVSIARAVNTAHENGVLHRDLKPANILMRSTGEADVADFGIAHLVDDALGTSQALTMTPLYTAPEVFDGVESGAASDIYSVGATLYALLNGYPAYGDPQGSTSMLSLMRRINEEPVPRLPANVPPALAAVVIKAMQKNPHDRHTSAGQLAGELAAADLSLAAAAPRRRGLVVAAVLILLAAIVGAALATTMLRSGNTIANDPEFSGPVESTTTPTEQPSPPVPAAGPTAVTLPIDASTVGAAAQQVLVRIESFGCTGANVETGVALNDGLVVTRERLLTAPWFTDVIYRGKVLRARPETSDPDHQLAFVAVDDADALGVLPGASVSAGAAVGLVGIDGDAAPAVLTTSPLDPDHLVAVLDNATAGNPIEPVDAIVTSAGDFVGIVAVADGVIDVMTTARIGEGWARVPPDYGCASLTRDLDANEAESAVSPAIADLLTMQQLSNAYANENWPLVRLIEPAKAELTDQRFVEGWRPLRQGFVYPVERSDDAGGLSRWRIALIGHETWQGSDLTTLFCLTWTVNPSSGAVVQTNEDNVKIYGSQPSDAQQAGFVDPAELRDLIDEQC